MRSNTRGEVLLLAGTVFLLTKSIDGEFLLQPKSQLAPLYGVAYFNCSVINDAISGWNFQFGSGIANWPLHRESLSAKGFEVLRWQTGSRMDSILSANATRANNRTTVRCIASGGQTISDSAVLTAYGPPDPPQSLSIAAVADRKIAIKWTASFSFGTWLLYKTIVTNVATGNMSESNWTYGEMFTYYGSSDGPCNLYQFTVIAGNSAGTSGASQPLIATVPTVPQVESVHSVVQSRPNATAYFYIKARYCQGYSVKEYVIKLTAVVNNSSTSIGPYFPSNANYTAIIVQLQPNVKYIYIITAASAVGNSSSSGHILYTTDVQSSTITGIDHQLNVTCFFAEGTLAKGCVVCLEKSGEVVYKMIPRVNGTAKGVIRTELSVDCYNISVVDWEEDGSIGSLHVPVDSAILLNSSSQRCDTTSAALALSPTPVGSLLSTLPSEFRPTASSTTHISIIPGLTQSELDANTKLDNSSIGLIAAGAVCGVAILSVAMVVTMVLGCHLKTRKMIVSIIFPRSTEIHSTFTLPPQTSVIPKPQPCLSCHNQFVTNQNAEIEMALYDAVQLNRTNTLTLSGPQPYEELMRPHKLSSPYIHPPSWDYPVLSQFPSYSVLENNPLQCNFNMHDPFHEYAVLEAPATSHQYEETVAVYEDLCESVPTAGSNV